MQTFYIVLKFVHVAAVILWLGGVVAVGMLNARVAHERDPAALAPLARASRFFGSAVVGPSALATLVAGVGMVLASGMSFATLWIAWGLTGIVIAVLLGTTLIRSTGEQLGAAMQEGRDGSAGVVRLRQRLRNLSILNLLVLFSIVAAMVFKPTL